MKKLTALLFATVLFALPLRANELPDPPAGFGWQKVPAIKASFLRPDGWFFREEMQKGTQAYFITREDISNTGEFKTGLTLNVFHLKSDSVVERGKLLIANMASTHNVTSWSKTVGPFEEFGCDLKDTDATGTILMHALTVANPKTHTLYLFIFESPEADWPAAWKVGKQIMDTLSLNDEY